MTHRVDLARRTALMTSQLETKAPRASNSGHFSEASPSQAHVNRRRDGSSTQAPHPGPQPRPELGPRAGSRHRRIQGRTDLRRRDRRRAVVGVRQVRPERLGFAVREALYFVCGVDLTAIEGIDEIHALTLVGEFGTDFTKWPTVKHFASWLGLCPNWKQTGGKVKSSKTRKGKNRAATALRLAAFSLIRSHSDLGAYLRRQRSRMGAPIAITATAHKLARIIYNLMRYGLAYSRQEEALFAEQVRTRLEKQLHRRAKELGFDVVRVAPHVGDVEPPLVATPA